MQNQRISNLLSYQGIPLWRNIRVIRAVTQIVSALIVIFLVLFFVNNVISAANSRGISLGFDFLETSAGFPISESIIEKFMGYKLGSLRSCRSPARLLRDR